MYQIIVNFPIYIVLLNQLTLITNDSENSRELLIFKLGVLTGLQTKFHHPVARRRIQAR